jgi:glycosyltransferase involved in cell wall biosynthesis
VRILIFHGYLLGGTGSNVYNARLAAALVGLGHEVHLLSQDRHPEEYSFVDAVGEWEDATLRVRELRASQHTAGLGRCTVYRPHIGGLLPVYVADRYEGIEARTFAQCTERELARYIEANVAAVRELVVRVRPQIALANHLVMGPVILARALGGELPYAVKVHGSALEYTVKPQPERFLGLAREGVTGARVILVGSRHTALSLWDTLRERSLVRRTRLGPPGVDVARFAPRDPSRARAGLGALTARLRADGRQPAAMAASASGARASGACPAGTRRLAQSAFARDDAAAARALARVDPEQDRLVAFVGKLIVSKGVDLLLAAWPLVLESVPRARLVVVGFGADRQVFESLLAALVVGDLDRARGIALAGRALEGADVPPAGETRPVVSADGSRTGQAAGAPLRHLLAFLERLQGEGRERYLAAARALSERVLWTGRLDHAELAELLPACEAVVVPSTFPESFGMVAVEAAACGALPISAAHSGLAEVSDALARALPRPAAGWLSFPLDDGAVRALAERVVGWLQADPDLRRRTRVGLVSTVGERWSWEGVARGVIEAACGHLDRLQVP